MRDAGAVGGRAGVAGTALEWRDGGFGEDEVHTALHREMVLFDAERADACAHDVVCGEDQGKGERTRDGEGQTV